MTPKEKMFQETRDRLALAQGRIMALEREDRDHLDLPEARFELQETARALKHLNALYDYLGDDGKLSAFAWPGGYQVVYFDQDGNMFCCDCANDPAYFPEITSSDIYWEGPAMECDGLCRKMIESEYGDPDKEEGE